MCLIIIDEAILSPKVIIFRFNDGAMVLASEEPIPSNRDLLSRVTINDLQ